MPDRAPIRTLKISSTLFEADREIRELEFLEPTSALYDELERVTEWNSHAKTRAKIVPTGLVLLEHLTGLMGSTLQKVTFSERAEANEIAAEILGEKVDAGED